MAFYCSRRYTHIDLVMTWYAAKASDLGAGLNSQHFYVEGETIDEATGVARQNVNNDMDPNSVNLTELEASTEDILHRLVMASGHNVAYTSDGEKITRTNAQDRQ